jgi:hypothetical protein
LVDDPLAETQKQLEIFKNVWTDKEKAVFTDKIALYGVKLILHIFNLIFINISS